MDILINAYGKEDYSGHHLVYRCTFQPYILSEHLLRINFPSASLSSTKPKPFPFSLKIKKYLQKYITISPFMGRTGSNAACIIRGMHRSGRKMISCTGERMENPRKRRKETAFKLRFLRMHFLIFLYLIKFQNMPCRVDCGKTQKRQLIYPEYYSE